MSPGAALLAILTTAAPLRFGADAQGGAPYVFYDAVDPNRLTGFEVELANELARRLGTTARLVPGPWDRLLELLARGDFDVAINGIEVSESARAVALLSEPYFRAAEQLTVRAGDGAAPRTLAELKGRKVGTLPGSAAEKILLRVEAEVRTYDGGQDDIYKDLALGRIDAVLLDQPAAHYYGDIDPRFVAVPGEFGSVEYAVALPKEAEARLAQVNAALRAMRDDGFLRRLDERWGLWSAENAALLHDANPTPLEPPLEFERWKDAVGTQPPFLERVRDRYPRVLPMLLRGAGMTLLVSTLAMTLAVGLGLALAFLRRYGSAPLRVLSRAYVEFFRGTPLLIQLTMVYFGLPQLGVQLDPMTAGILALGLNYAAAEAENYRAGLESVPQGQVEAATVLGFTRFQTLRFITGPQAVRVSLPPMTNDFIALLKDSSLVSLVTLTELTKTYSNLANAMRDHLGLGVLVAVMYLLLGLPFAQLARVMERRFSRYLPGGDP